MRYLAFVFCTIVALLSTFLTAQAQMVDKDYHYVGGYIGGADVDSDILSEDTNKGGTFGVFLGKKYNEWRAELELSYLKVDAKSSPAQISTFQGFVNGYYDFGFDSPLYPYLGLGMGMMSFDASKTAESVDDDAEFASQLMFGIRYDLDPFIALNAEFRYSWPWSTHSDTQGKLLLGAAYKF